MYPPVGVWSRGGAGSRERGEVERIFHLLSQLIRFRADMRKETLQVLYLKVSHKYWVRLFAMD